MAVTRQLAALVTEPKLADLKFAMAIGGRTRRTRFQEKSPAEQPIHLLNDLKSSDVASHPFRHRSPL
jgi:hypothetical protein